jgi:hypothetical protein
LIEENEDEEREISEAMMRKKLLGREVKYTKNTLIP